MKFTSLYKQLIVMSQVALSGHHRQGNFPSSNTATAQLADLCTIRKKTLRDIALNIPSSESQV